MDEADRRLIVATQAGLPLVPRPYDEIARRLGMERAKSRRAFSECSTAA